MLHKSEVPLFGYWFWAAKAYFYGEFVCYDKTVNQWNRIWKVNICLQSTVIYTTEMGSKRVFKAHQINLNNHSNYVRTSNYHKWTKKHDMLNFICSLWETWYFSLFPRAQIKYTEIINKWDSEDVLSIRVSEPEAHV